MLLRYSCNGLDEWVDTFPRNMLKGLPSSTHIQHFLAWILCQICHYFPLGWAPPAHPSAERDAKRFGDYTGKREDLVIRPLNFPHDSTQKAKKKYWTHKKDQTCNCAAHSRSYIVGHSAHTILALRRKVNCWHVSDDKVDISQPKVSACALLLNAVTRSLFIYR